jgi:hypothetical protein
VKEGCELARVGIDACQVWAFMQIAPVTRQGEVVPVIGTAVLFGHDVLNMMLQFAMSLV